MTPTPRPPAAPKLSWEHRIAQIRVMASGAPAFSGQLALDAIADDMEALAADNDRLRGLLEKAIQWTRHPPETDVDQSMLWALDQEISDALAADGDGGGQ